MRAFPKKRRDVGRRFRSEPLISPLAPFCGHRSVSVPQVQAIRCFFPSAFFRAIRGNPDYSTPASAQKSNPSNSRNRV